MKKNIQPNNPPYTKEEEWLLAEINKRIARYKKNHSPLKESLNLAPEEEHLAIFEFASGHIAGYLDGLYFLKRMIEEKYKNPYQKRKAPHLISHIGGVQKKEKVIDIHQQPRLFDFLEKIIEDTNYTGCF